MPRFLLRPNGYNQHHIAGVTITKHGRETVVDKGIKEFLVDEEQGPLRLSQSAYDHFRAEFGKGLIAEPLVGGEVLDGDGAARHIAELEQDLSGKKVELAEVRQAVVAEIGRLETHHRAEVDGLRARIAELEAQLAAKKKPERPAEKQ